MEEQESALDVIFELRELLKQQDAKIDMLQKNLAMVNSKVNEGLFTKLIERIPGKDIKTEVKVTPIEHKPEPVITAPVPAPIAPANPKPAKAPPKSIRAFGRLQDENGKNLHGVQVQILNGQNQVIKKTTTNRAGLWVSFLPPGEYVAEFSMAGAASGITC